MQLSKDLAAASATPLVLSILRQGDSYGYDIIQRVRVLTEGQLQWADGMLYPILHRLEKRKLVESYWGKSEAGRKRKYYRLSENGLAELNQQHQQWQQLMGWITRSMEAQPCSN